jgi:hypothetical protein
MPLPSSSVQPRPIVCGRFAGLRYVPLGRGPSSFREKKQKRQPAGREKEDG